MEKRTVGGFLIGVGVTLAAISLLADPLELARHPDFGWRQILGIVVGAVLIGAGLFRARSAQ